MDHRRKCRFFPNANIPGPKPKFIVGDFLRLIGMGITSYDEEMTKKYGRICGYFETNKAVILCSDVDMIKHVMFKDSQYFLNRRVNINYSFFKLIFMEIIYSYLFLRYTKVYLYIHLTSSCLI